MLSKIDIITIVIEWENIEVLPSGNNFLPKTNKGQCHKYKG